MPKKATTRNLPSKERVVGTKWAFCIACHVVYVTGESVIEKVGGCYCPKMTCGCPLSWGTPEELNELFVIED